MNFVFPNAQAEFCGIRIEVEFASNETISHLAFFDVPKSLDQAVSQFQKEALALKFNDALALVWKGESWLPIPHWLLFTAYKNWLGNHPHWEDREEQLLCHCFGISSEEISSFLAEEKGTGTTLKEVTDSLMAGGGCGTCRKDIRCFLIPRRKESIDFCRQKIGGRTPLAAWVEADEVLQGRVEVMGIKGRALYFQTDFPLNIEDLAAMEESLCTHFSDELILMPMGDDR